ncbi:MAG: polyprenyl synthetase family protein [Candidatus Saccharimonadaceae bacterium]|nr:polyprenyl synthetase family protein [Candidatus Saccharimonadaceae bacterium]
MFGGDVKDLVYPAAAIEILHNATLIVDDIINHSEIRRNQPTCWKKFGQSIAECSSMIHFASVFADLSYANNSSKLINFYSKILKIVVEGEIKDILFERSGRKDEDYVINKRYSVKGTTISK